MGPFWRRFFEKFCIALFLGKILVANYRIVCEVNFAPKAQNFSTDIRKSAVLDAVLEDKPAQPLPCGSYLVQGLCLMGSLTSAGAQRRRFLFRNRSFKRSSVHPSGVRKKRAKHRMVSGPARLPDTTRVIFQSIFKVPKKNCVFAVKE